MAKDTSSHRVPYTRFEKARIIGARALQIAMGAPVLLAEPGNLVDPVVVAEKEYAEDLIPITVSRSAAEVWPVPDLVYSASDSAT